MVHVMFLFRFCGALIGLALFCVFAVNEIKTAVCVLCACGCGPCLRVSYYFFFIVDLRVPHPPAIEEIDSVDEVCVVCISSSVFIFFRFFVFFFRLLFS